MSEVDLLVQRFEQSQTTLQGAVQDLDDARATEVWYGTWSAREIVAHIAGWEAAMAEALEKMARGERPTAEGIDTNDTEGTNSRFADRATDKTLSQVMSELMEGGSRFAAAIRALPLERLAEGKTGRRIVETMIEHPNEHLPALREWRAGRTPS